MPFGPEALVAEILASGQPGDALAGCELVLDSLTASRTRAGQPLTTLTFRDRTGNIAGKHWGDQPAWKALVRSTVAVVGELNEYNGTLEITVRALQPAPKADRSKFQQLSREQVREMYGMLRRLVERVKHGGYRSLLEAMFPADPGSSPEPVRRLVNSFCTATAAVRNHHNYQGGLLEHTLGVTYAALGLSLAYPFTDRDLLITAGILHDVGKVVTYDVRPLDSVEMNDRGRLFDHIVEGVRLLDRVIAEWPGIALSDGDRDRLYHCILAHQGKHEWASPVEPRFFEAMLLHFADNLDARVGKLLRAMAQAPAGQPWVYVDSELGQFRPLAIDPTAHPYFAELTGPWPAPVPAAAAAGAPDRGPAEGRGTAPGQQGRLERPDQPGDLGEPGGPEGSDEPAKPGELDEPFEIGA